MPPAPPVRQPGNHTIRGEDDNVVWDEERVEEIARMLSGAATTEEARAAARRLLAEAQIAPKKLRKRA